MKWGGRILTLEKKTTHQNVLVELRTLALISGQNYQKLNSAIRHEFNHYSNTCIFSL